MKTRLTDYLNHPNTDPEILRRVRLDLSVSSWVVALRAMKEGNVKPLQVLLATSPELPSKEGWQLISVKLSKRGPGRPHGDLERVLHLAKLDHDDRLDILKLQIERESDPERRRTLVIAVANLPAIVSAEWHETDSRVNEKRLRSVIENPSGAHRKWLKRDQTERGSIGIEPLPTKDKR
jgi:hypothetical protein